MKTIIFPRTPKSTGQTALACPLSAAEILLIVEALRIAVQTINETACATERVTASANLTETLRMYAERMEDLRERLAV